MERVVKELVEVGLGTRLRHLRREGKLGIHPDYLVYCSGVDESGAEVLIEGQGKFIRVHLDWDQLQTIPDHLLTAVSGSP